MVGIIQIQQAYGQYWEKYKEHIDLNDGTLHDSFVGEDEDMSIWLLSNAKKVKMIDNENYCWIPVILYL